MNIILINRSFSVKLHFCTIIITISFCVVSPLHSARTDPNVTSLVVNTPVIFNCLSLGGPNNTYYWVYDRTGERLSNVSELNVISHASRGGSYTCTVRNEAGYDHAISTLNGKPVHVV